MPFFLWFLIIGLVLTLMALLASVLEKLPLSASLIYILVGLGIGPLGIGLLVIDPVDKDTISFLERFSETVVVLSLFAAGLKMRLSLREARWFLPLRLATLSMSLTVGFIALIGVYLLNLPLGVAVLLGAVLAPTDPVLAGDVQMESPHDQDRLRFSLTGEAGFNDGAAFPFVMLGLGLMGFHELGTYGWRWLTVDVLWAIFAGLAVGALLGALTGRFVIYLRRHHQEAVGTDDFLALGLVFLSYGVALLIHSYAFLAAFAAGYALRAVERAYGDEDASEKVKAAAQQEEGEEQALDKETAPAYMASAVLGFTEQFERIGTVFFVIIIGAILHTANWSWQAVGFALASFFVVRPVAVWLGLLGSRTKDIQRGLIAWFGIRGIGSIYYLMFAFHEGVSEHADILLTYVLVTIALSMVLHGTSVTPIMNWYRNLQGEKS